MPSPIFKVPVRSICSYITMFLIIGTWTITACAETQIYIESPFIKRIFKDRPQGFVTTSYQSQHRHSDLIKGHASHEGSVKINGKRYVLGGDAQHAFSYAGYTIQQDHDGGHCLAVTFTAPSELPSGLQVKLLYKAPGNVPVLIKSVRIDNLSSKAVRVDGVEIEAIDPTDDQDMSLTIKHDYVGNGMTDRSTYGFPHELDRWLVSGARFNSFGVYEFVLPTGNEELRGVTYRRATKELWPWTTVRWLACGLAPAKDSVEEYYRAIDLIAEVGYEVVWLNHGWIDGVLTSPLFTSYADHIPRPDLFPNGWDDIKKLTDYAHGKGLKITYYATYNVIWDKEKSKAWRDYPWRVVYSEEDLPNHYFGEWTLDVATDWGLYINRKTEECMVRGGFDGYVLDAPYYGDISVYEGRGCKPGGAGQLLAWERQIEFYQRMAAQGYIGEVATGFSAWAHGNQHISTSGYNEDHFGELGMWAQILSTRSGAYEFTKESRPEMGMYFIPVVSWLDGPDLLPMEDEENLKMFDAYMANCFGYGFEGLAFCQMPYEGPKSKAIVKRWLDFWKSHADFFKQGDLLHVREPDGKRLDAVMHVLVEGDRHRALLVVYNPAKKEQTDELVLPLDVLDLPLDGWTAISESGMTPCVKHGKIQVTVPARDATWYELQLD